MVSVFISVDVGSYSVRAGAFDINGNLVVKAAEQRSNVYSQTRKHPSEYKSYEQKTTEIWDLICVCVRECTKYINDLNQNKTASYEIKGISFDATTSLVVLDENDAPVSVDINNENSDNNIIMWMDHRAVEEANFINDTGHECLKYIGGKISPEMQMPKIVWLKKYIKHFSKINKFFDLVDFLVYKSTGADYRGCCSTVCKWTYNSKEKKWHDDFFEMLHLQELCKNQYKCIQGSGILDVGQAAGKLSSITAREFGLEGKESDIVVGIGLIDAHCGAVGALGGLGKEGFSVENSLSIISGTSSCHMFLSKKKVFVKGVWGPYFSGMLPDFWLLEGGQSSSGSLIDYIIYDSGVFETLKKKAESKMTSIYAILNETVYHLEARMGAKELTKDFHLLGYFHGNRAPRADPTLKGIICGITLEGGLEALAIKYLAAIQSIAYGTRHIIEEMRNAGCKIENIAMCGGGIKNELLLREHSNITQCPILLQAENETVLLGGCITAAVAAGCYDDMLTAIEKMGTIAKVIKPDETKVSVDFHNKKYRIFKEMYHDQLKYRKMMAD